MTESGTEARRHGGTEGIGAFSRQHNLVLAALYDSETHTDVSSALRHETPSCLRASVPSCLSFPLQLHTIPPEDPVVYDMICHADTIGVFQIESRAQMSMLPRLKPRSFYDLVIEVAIVRPGPIQGDMVHPYLRRRNKEEDEDYPNEDVKRVLKKTLGVPLFQEQAMSLAIVAAGFTPGEADQLRRAIAAWKARPHQIDQFGERLVKGMLERGYARDFAERCFKQIQGFSGYGFPESHAASFALLVYVSAWLKCHYPAEFAAALINSQPMGFYAPAQIVRDAQEHGVEVRGIDVNCSEWDCSLEEQAPRHQGTKPQSEERGNASDVPSCLRASMPSCLRLGMRLVRGLSQPDADAIAAAVRAHGPFTSIHDFWRTSGVRVSVLRRLAKADAFQSMGLDRQHALWQVRGLHDEPLPIFDVSAAGDARGATCENRAHPPAEPRAHGTGALPPQQIVDRQSTIVNLPSVPDLRKIAHDYAAIGLSLRAHPISYIREELTALGATPNVQLKDASRWPKGKRIAVAGLTLVRQRPSTANGIVFMTLEDETGVANLIVRPDVYRRCRRAARHGVAIIARGIVERQGEVVHVLAQHIEDVPVGEDTPEVRSRDFH
jgi:error-prone DNA polymerase